MSTIISGSTPSSFGDDTTINGDIIANNLPTHGSIVGYQQGVWTPVFESTTVSGGALAGSPYSDVSWRRIGDLVTLNYNFTLGSGVPSNLNVNDVWAFSGIPYDAAAFGQCLSQAWTTGSWDSGNRWLMVALLDNNTGIIKWGGSFQGNQATVRASKTFRCSLQYTTDDTTWTPINGATVS